MRARSGFLFFGDVFGHDWRTRVAAVKRVVGGVGDAMGERVVVHGGFEASLVYVAEREFLVTQYKAATEERAVVPDACDPSGDKAGRAAFGETNVRATNLETARFQGT